MQTIDLETEQKLLTLAESAARAAGALALSLQGNNTVEEKGSRDLVTAADYACEELIIRRIREAFPGHGIVAEESGKSAVADRSEFTWYVDPIDGTINYARSLPLWGISIACFRNNQALAGVIFLPALNECYTATASGPAMLNGSAISVSKISNPQSAIVFNSDFNTVSDPVIRQALNDLGIAARRDQVATVMRSRCMGSAVISSAWVAAGRVDAYLMVRVNAWDIAAGSLIVSRAGGTVTGAGGNPWVPGVNHVLVSNGHLHDHLVRPDIEKAGLA